MMDMGMTDHLVSLDHISLIALAFVVVVGLPHGAFDGAIAQQLGYSRTWRAMCRFIVVYLGLAGAVVAFWIWQPGLALALFLLICHLCILAIVMQPPSAVLPGLCRLRHMAASRCLE